MSKITYISTNVLPIDNLLVNENKTMTTSEWIIPIEMFPFIAIDVLTYEALQQIKNPNEIRVIKFIHDSSASRLTELADLLKHRLFFMEEIPSLLASIANSEFNVNKFASGQIFLHTEFQHLLKLNYATITRELENSEESFLLGVLQQAIIKLTNQVWDVANTTVELHQQPDFKDMLSSMLDKLRHHADDLCDCPKCKARREAEKSHPKQ